MKIGVLSDTHGSVPKQVYTFFEECDELWHAGDMGRGVLEELRAFKPTRAVYGNMDDYDLRYQLPGTDVFSCEGHRVMMTHIGGWPGHYPPEILKSLQTLKPDIFICGHSHILKVMYDQQLNLFHINPGAAGRQGFQRVSTLVRFILDPPPEENYIHHLEVLDFSKIPTDES